MKIKIFSKQHRLFTDDPLWPSNQRSTSNFVVDTNFNVIEIVDFGDDVVFINKTLNQEDFEVTFEAKN